MSEKMQRQQKLYDSFSDLVLEEQWSIEGWIQKEQVSIYELDDTLGLVKAAMIFFRTMALQRSGMFTVESPTPPPTAQEGREGL